MTEGKQISCALCGAQVSKRQSLQHGTGRACRTHTEVQKAAAQQRSAIYAAAAAQRQAAEEARKKTAAAQTQARQFAETIRSLAAARKFSLPFALDYFGADIPAELTRLVRDMVLKGVAALVLFACALTGARGGEVPAEMTDDELEIRALMDANMAACTEEDMDKLLALMSEEMPNRQLFINTVDQAWSVDDTYNRIEDLQVLSKTNAPYGKTKYPYATAKVRQTTYYVTQRRNTKQKFRELCPNGQCAAEDLPHLMAVAPRNETVEYECLFKHENGQWKIVANVSVPVPPGAPSVYVSRKRSVF